QFVPEVGTEFLHIEEFAILFCVLLLELRDLDPLLSYRNASLSLGHLSLSNSLVSIGRIDLALKLLGFQIVRNTGTPIGQILQYEAATSLFRTVIVSVPGLLNLIVLVNRGSTRPGLGFGQFEQFPANVVEILFGLDCILALRLSIVETGLCHRDSGLSLGQAALFKNHRL